MVGMFEPAVRQLGRSQESFGSARACRLRMQDLHLRPKVEELRNRGLQLRNPAHSRYTMTRTSVDSARSASSIGPSFVITVRQGVASELNGARTRLEQHPKLLALGTNSCSGDPDQVIKGLRPVVADLESDIEQVEAPSSPARSHRPNGIYDLRRESRTSSRGHPLLAVLTGVERNVDDAELRPYLRDVPRPPAFISEEVAAQKDLLAPFLQGTWPSSRWNRPGSACAKTPQWSS